ncbi:DUF1707 domain-containing protein [Mycobacterium sp. MYCO198283]|uniref:DUF1707 domain-containing protein n=1 Tax=Mycobacterium sp. MYCO198283 TaxID=2883505 RepID=UPI001E424D8A|nr:DUF1707 domain-containing protein [Mycobacterium sp. MYCO198283]MCG5433258.1 DUF1707 domain-containing protein [Mycobacterium sp. MYCO198283]
MLAPICHPYVLPPRTAHRPPADPSTRAGDQERRRTAERLGHALTLGYLGVADYDARLQRVYDATTVGELRALLADLPVAELRRHERHAAARVHARRSLQAHAALYAVMVVVVLTVWLSVGLAAGAWYFWPIWPILGGGVAVASHAIPVRLLARP